MPQYSDSALLREIVLHLFEVDLGNEVWFEEDAISISALPVIKVGSPIFISICLECQRSGLLDVKAKRRGAFQVA